MTSKMQARGRAGALPEGDLRDPQYRLKFIFGDEPRNPNYRATLLGDFLFFGALLRR
jgi:hypothetical protein